MPKTRTNRQTKNLHLRLAIFRYYKLISVLLLIIIVVAGYYLILLPKYEQVGAGSRYNLETVENEFSKRLAHLASLQQLIQNYNKISQTELVKLKTILPREKDIPSLFVQLQDLTASHNLLLTSVSINETPDLIKAAETFGTIKKLNISLSLIGTQADTYDQIKRFLSALESNLRLFDVTALYFNPDSPAYTLNISTYYY